MLNPLVSRFRPDLSISVKNIAKKTGSCKGETDNRHRGPHLVKGKVRDYSLKCTDALQIYVDKYNKYK